eukprot:c30498_g1_i1.p1 GENE.c30498_g1_i1~~c30498_g1_i1.p1  ORF type:complete len:240 (+),score=116.12 c30498_g1_i1:52-771(+)
MLKRATYLFGLAVRETGQALDRVGCRMQDKYMFKEKLSRHRQIMNLYDRHPSVSNDSWVAPSASVIGDVTVSSQATVWYNAVVKGDLNGIRIGSFSNIQDRAVLVSAADDHHHGSTTSIDIADHVTIGQGAILHSCKIGQDSVIGVSAIIGEGAQIGEGSVVAPATVVPPGVHIPAGQYWAGNPAKFVRAVTQAEREQNHAQAEAVFSGSAKHKEEFSPYSTPKFDLEAIAERASRSAQ